MTLSCSSVAPRRQRTMALMYAVFILSPLAKLYSTSGAVLYNLRGDSFPLKWKGPGHKLSLLGARAYGLTIRLIFKKSNKNFYFLDLLSFFPYYLLIFIAY